MKPRDVIIGAFAGVQMTKVRPAVVLSTERYHRYRPDVVIGLITSQVPRPFDATDCALVNWNQAGLHVVSYFRLFLVTLPQKEVRIIGRLSDSDWNSVQACFRAGFGMD